MVKLMAKYTNRIPTTPFIDFILYKKLPQDCISYVSGYLKKYIYYNKINRSYNLRIRENKRDKHMQQYFIRM